MPIIIPASMPDLRGYTYDTPNDWRGECVEQLSDFIENVPLRSRRVCFYTVERRNSGQARVIQLFDDNWSLHVQCVAGGDEVRTMGVSPDDALISLDIEKGPRARFDEESTEINFRPIRKAVLDAIGEEALVHLGLHDLPEPRGEHLIWEVMPFTESNISQIARRMADYAVLLPRAMRAMVERANENDVRIELLA